MPGYRPDWLGAALVAVLVGLCMLAVPKMSSRTRWSAWPLIVAGLIGVGLTFGVRNVLRHFGI